ncbi:MAG: hypothetical protein WA724_09695 [Candidatus Dormiibacterota bacterium]
MTYEQDLVDALESDLGEKQAQLGEAIGVALELATDCVAGGSPDAEYAGDQLIDAVLALNDAVSELWALLKLDEEGEPDDP